jgi:ubiquinone/menaquinone biosynthesis C-methylase UbiE
MKLLKIIQDIGYKVLAKQLRLPSGWLANLTGSSMNKANALLYQLTLDNLAIADGDSILEIGFGNGKHFAELSAKVNNLKITGIDHAPKMVADAMRRNKHLHKSGAMNLSVGSSDALPYGNDSFDKTFCINVIYFWENPSLHLKEIYRVLKPGGIFCAGFRPKDNLAKFPFSKFGFNLYSEAEWRHLLTENGFTVMASQDGKHLEEIMNQRNTPFESLCVVCMKPMEE